MKITLIINLTLCFTTFTSAQRVVSVDSSSSRIVHMSVGTGLKKTGTMGLSIGVPCVAIGGGLLAYSNMMDSPLKGYTTSKSIAEESVDKKYITTEDYINKQRDYNRKKSRIKNAGLILVPLGGALSIISVPLVIYGKKMDVEFYGSGVNINAKF